MNTKRRATRARLAAIGVAAASAVLVAGCGAANEGGDSGGSGGASGTISGAGATSQQAAMQAWKAAFEGANNGATVNYDAVGSGGGRTQFVDGGVAFAGSDSAIKDDQLAKAKTRCGGQLIEIPDYVSPIAVAYNLPGVQQLNLAPATVAGIFKGQITTWNDPKIAADNPGAQLPATRINPVHRADDSGTTNNFTDYLNKAAGSVWTDKAADKWPVAGGEAAQGTSGVRDAISKGAGSIGYIDASQAAQLGKANLKVGNTYVGPTADAAAKIFEESQKKEGGDPGQFAYTLNRTANNAYPAVLVSYLLACGQYPDAAQADTTKAFLKYVTSQEGQQAAAQSAGAAPIPDSLRQQITPVIDGIKAANG
ncbi:phosphate ABC transporter substrate-binding protein PstS [Pseudonocardia endophytica]|uniref:Phosphate-binding protein n=1 Tax=Pseudonocardia endophytica TaxID=401976 RepID=A0A4R1I0K8_PSEEN|nr:phosphate ABC transporter substrate-binding protein PstS [Pseudonocardia endophytica]TCK27055.1 phosphate ABC transporter substrate-binding protein (PhoT family) [Pseudonocardia endophytica]